MKKYIPSTINKIEDLGGKKTFLSLERKEHNSLYTHSGYSCIDSNNIFLKSKKTPINRLVSDI